MTHDRHRIDACTQRRQTVDLIRTNWAHKQRGLDTRSAQHRHRTWTLSLAQNRLNAVTRSALFAQNGHTMWRRTGTESTQDRHPIGTAAAQKLDTEFGT